ncbi:MAG: hypothetical protein AB8B99_22875 [Phormidesmis sp.]
MTSIWHDIYKEDTCVMLNNWLMRAASDDVYIALIGDDALAGG